MDVIIDSENRKLKQATILSKNEIDCFVQLPAVIQAYDERSKRTNIQDFGYRVFQVS